jgi:predicted transcriptional regulator
MMSLDDWLMQTLRDKPQQTFGEIHREATKVFGQDMYWKVDACLQKLREKGAVGFSRQGREYLWSVLELVRS